MERASGFLLDVYEGAQQCSPSEFNEYALNELKKLIHFDSAGFASFAVTPEKKVAIQSLHLRSVDPERFRDRAKTVGVEKLGRNGTLASRDAVASNAFAQRGKSVIVDIAKKFSHPDILNYCRKYETAHSLALFSNPTADGTIGGIALWRAERKNPYLEEQGQVATLVLPHLFQAMSINRRLATASPAGAHGTTIALASLDGHLYFIEPETIRLLQLEWAQWTPPRLPRGLMETLQQNREHVFVGVSIEMRATLQGKMICLRIAERDIRMGLTAAEHRVAKLAVTGMPYKEIAKQLEVSPATIRNQLHSVYRKLGISNKTTLAAVIRP